jgi:hypothetical protein
MQLRRNISDARLVPCFIFPVITTLIPPLSTTTVGVAFLAILQSLLTLTLGFVCSTAPVPSPDSADDPAVAIRNFRLQHLYLRPWLPTGVHNLVQFLSIPLRTIRSTPHCWPRYTYIWNSSLFYCSHRLLPLTTNGPGYSVDTVTAYCLDGRLRSPSRQDILLYSTASRPTMGTTQIPIW